MDEEGLNFGVSGSIEVYILFPKDLEGKITLCSGAEYLYLLILCPQAPATERSCWDLTVPSPGDKHSNNTCVYFLYRIERKIIFRTKITTRERCYIKEGVKPIP